MAKMNKTEAAEYLEVSKRSINRYISDGQLKATYVRSKTGPQIELDDEEVRRLKEELEMPVHRSVVTNQRDIRESVSSADETSLSKVVTSLQSLAQISEIALAMEAIALHYTNTHLRQKMLLTIPEAVMVSGVSKAGLRRSLTTGELPAIKEGGRWKVRPEDLRDFVCKKVDKSAQLN